MKVYVIDTEFLKGEQHRATETVIETGPSKIKSVLSLELKTIKILGGFHWILKEKMRTSRTRSLLSSKWRLDEVRRPEPFSWIPKGVTVVIVAESWREVI